MWSCGGRRPSSSVRKRRRPREWGQVRRLHGKQHVHCAGLGHWGRHRASRGWVGASQHKHGQICSLSGFCPCCGCAGAAPGPAAGGGSGTVLHALASVPAPVSVAAVAGVLGRRLHTLGRPSTSGAGVVVEQVVPVVTAVAHEVVVFLQVVEVAAPGVGQGTASLLWTTSLPAPSPG